MSRPELLIDQLRHIGIEDLLSACQSHPVVAQLCQNSTIWQARLLDLFPDLDLTQITDPINYYLQHVMFGGEIYVHSLLPQGQIENRLLPYEPIAYNRLFEATKKIAESTGQSYVIVYSRPERHRVNTIAYQTPDSTVVVPGPAEKVTQVDIVTNPDPDWVRAVLDFGQGNLTQTTMRNLSTLGLAMSLSHQING